MKKIFYRYTPAVFCLGSLLLALFIYSLYLGSLMLASEYHWILWVVLTVLLAIIGAWTGNLIHNIHVAAHTDELTKLWNRRQLSYTLEHEVQRSKRAQIPLCIAVIDVDDFKEVNDKFGHTTGDKLLENLSQIFIESTRSSDVITRWGGDEFIIVLGQTDIQGAVAVAERIRNAVETECSAYGVTVSIGIMPIEPTHDIAYWLMLADKTLFEAKKHKNKVTVFRNSLAG